MKQFGLVYALFFLLLPGISNAQNSKSVESGPPPTFYALIDEARKNIESNPELALQQLENIINNCRESYSC